MIIGGVAVVGVCMILGEGVDADEFIVALVMLLSEVDMEHMFEVQFFRQSHAMWP